MRVQVSVHFLNCPGLFNASEFLFLALRSIHLVFDYYFLFFKEYSLLICNTVQTFINLHCGTEIEKNQTNHEIQ